ncbi:microspherule protein 1 [Caerostris darwini]|uniref:Microspherule protein 1 n=1 Tax=Caerostris darwini TaxID=1538125 RepID=A0AAV4VTR1_9ARAC|nr:microspherule protein 1 [Caerostris darwini]
MSIVSDSSQEASNAAISTCLTPVSSPNLFLKAELSDLQNSNLFGNSQQDLLKPVPSSSAEQSQKRRSSSRSIKRKKFDDELVESSLIKSSRARPQNVAFPVLPTTTSLSLPNIVASPNTSIATNVIQPDINQSLALDKRKPRPAQKRIKKPKTNQANLNKDVSRWKPTDDFMLILSVQQTNDLEAVHRGVKFSSKFSLRDVQERWYALLYDAAISKAALFAIKQLSRDVLAQVQSKVLFSAEEEKLIASIPSDQGTLETFQQLLDSNASVFLPSRTAKVLHNHWATMKQYNLLQDYGDLPPLLPDDIPTFSDNEEQIDDADLQDSKDGTLDEEISGVHRKHLQEIKQLENEVPKWQVLVDCITGVSLPEFDSKTLAVMKGRIIRYLIQSQTATFGRSAKDNRVDIDLSLEGPAWKVSRRQGVIKLDSNGDFYLINEGKKPVYIDGKPVLAGNKYKLSNDSVIEITVLRFVFIMNSEAIAALRSKST